MVQPKRLAIICQHFYPEMLSTGLFMTHIATGLVEKGWPVRVYCSRPTYYAEGQDQADLYNQTTYRGVEVVRVPTLSTARTTLPRRMLNAITFLLAIGWFLYRDRKTLLGVINTTNPPFLGLVAWLAKWLLGLPYLTVIHDIYPDVAVRLGMLSPRSPITLLWNQLTRLIFNQSSGVVVIGRDMAELVRTKLSRRSAPPMTLIPHWADDAVIHPIAKAENRFVHEHGLTERFVIQYSGRMGRVHNLEPLIEAAQLLRATPALFQFIGDGAKLAKLVDRTKELGLTNVQFLPYQSYERLAETLSAADVGVVCLEENCEGVSVPSKTYGLLACARPILALMNQTSEIGQLVNESGCGVVISDATPAQIANTIQRLMTNTAERQQMAANALDTFQTDYRLGAAIERYDLFLRQHFGVPAMQPAIKAAAHQALPLPTYKNPAYKNYVELSEGGKVSRNESRV